MKGPHKLRRVLPVLLALALFGIAAGLRAPGITQEAIHDELHHVLAARALLADGSLSIAGGDPYLRARPLTVAIAALFSVSGESLAVARVPSLVAGSLMCALLFAWLASQGQPVAGALAGLLLALDPQAIIASQWARFYTLEELSFLVAIIASFALLTRTRRASPAPRDVALLAAVALAGFGFAIYLQLTTALGAAAVVALLGLAWSRPLLTRDDGSLRAGRIALLAGGVALALSAAWGLGFAAWLRDMATYTNLWAASAAGQYRFYFGILLEGYPGLWPLFPLWVLLALRRAPALTLFCTSIFGLAFVAHSLLAWKAWRYFEYAMPCFFAVSALGVTEGLVLLRRHLPALVRDLAPADLSERGVARISLALVVAVAGFGLASNRALVESARLVDIDDPSLSFPGMIRAEGTLSWSALGERLGPELAGVDAVVASDALKALYYLGRVDYELNRDHLEVGEGLEDEFFVDGPSGRPVVSESDSLARIMACHPSGVVVAERRLWGVPWSVPEEVAGYIAAHARREALPDAWGLLLFRWNHPEAARPDDCPTRVGSPASTGDASAGATG